MTDVWSRTTSYEVYASPEVIRGKTVWYIKRTKDKKILAKGKTISEAIKQYEGMVEDENMA